MSKIPGDKLGKLEDPGTGCIRFSRHRKMDLVDAASLTDPTIQVSDQSGVFCWMQSETFMLLTSDAGWWRPTVPSLGG
jgi:hypothetical protein